MIPNKLNYKLKLKIDKILLKLNKKYFNSCKKKVLWHLKTRWMASNFIFEKLKNSEENNWIHNFFTFFCMFFIVFFVRLVFVKTAYLWNCIIKNLKLKKIFLNSCEFEKNIQENWSKIQQKMWCLPMTPEVELGGQKLAIFGQTFFFENLKKTGKKRKFWAFP